MLPFEAHLMAAGWPKTRRGALHAARLRELAGEEPQVRSRRTGAPEGGVCSHRILTRRGTPHRAAVSGENHHPVIAPLMCQTWPLWASAGATM